MYSQVDGEARIKGRWYFKSSNLLIELENEGKEQGGTSSGAVIMIELLLYVHIWDSFHPF